MKASGVLIASRIVIALSACWLINCALALTPPGTEYGGIIRGPCMSSTVGYFICFHNHVSFCIGSGVTISGGITVDVALVIAGTAPGVLLCVLR